MNKRSLSLSLDKEIFNTIEIDMEGETHTLANIVVDEMLKDNNCIFSAYKLIHPLEEKVNIRISCNKGKPVVESVVDNMKKLEKEISSLIYKVEEIEGRTEYNY